VRGPDQSIESHAAGVWGAQDAVTVLAFMWLKIQYLGAI